MSSVIDVTEADFADQVIEQSRQKPVVVDFWAPWCGPCRMLGPILEKAVGERQGEMLLAKVDIDQNQSLAYQFRVESIPMVLAFKDGKAVDGFMGLLPEPEVRAFLDRLTPSEAERQLQRAAELAPAKPAEAEKLYRQVLEKEPDQPAALVGLARVLIQLGKDAEARDLLERVVGGDQAAEAEKLKNLLALKELGKEFGDVAALQAKVKADPENAETRYQFGCVLAGAGQYPAALEMLLAAAQRDRGLATGKARAAMVQIFHVVGARSELADSYRDKLTKLLY